MMAVFSPSPSRRRCAISNSYSNQRRVYRVYDLGFGVEGVGFKVQGLRTSLECIGFKVQGLGAFYLV